MSESLAVGLIERALLVRVHGLVQGVGFRPTVYRLAQRLGLRGRVSNDGQGLLIHLAGPAGDIEAFLAALTAEAPTLARIDHIEQETAEPPEGAGFHIADSASGPVRTGILPDAAVCADCAAEVLDPFARRFRYPFANCTHCGPRFSILEAVPWDRARTTMRAFPPCPACAAEYGDVNDRRFHAEPIACHACGPRAWLERADGKPMVVDVLTTLDAVDATCTLLQRGHIVAIKGIGGFQLACDASNEQAVATLRERKGRPRKPFALLARDTGIVLRHAEASAAELALLRSPSGPIVLLEARAGHGLAPSVAPGMGTLGFMLPNTPLHLLMLKRMDRPIVLTSGNAAGAPQAIANEEARASLAGIADYLLLHDRDIVRRVDDSVVRLMRGSPRLLRRARGYAPAPLRLPPGFADAPAVLALGGELKNTFCLLRDGEALLSHHIGDLEDPALYADFRRAVAEYSELYGVQPAVVAIDAHPDYLSAKFGRELAAKEGLRLDCVQHHHAHGAAVMAEHGLPPDAGPVLAVLLDGIGMGDDGTLWGGEFLRMDYHGYERLGCFKPVPLPGGGQAMREPWRNTYAQLMAEMGWARLAMNYGELDIVTFLAGKPRALLDGMLAQGVNTPLASSCGRLFDAVAAACGVCRERVLHEGQAAMELEALVDREALQAAGEDAAYPFAIPRLGGKGLPYVEPLAMWQALLGDLVLRTPVPVIAARFHRGLADVLIRMVEKLGEDAGGERLPVVLGGGVFQNRTLLELVSGGLEQRGFRVLLPRLVPANDGGLALGQAAIAAARARKH